jgi:hypothetical protein
LSTGRSLLERTFARSFKCYKPFLSHKLPAKFLSVIEIRFGPKRPSTLRLDQQIDRCANDFTRICGTVDPAC